MNTHRTNNQGFVGIIVLLLLVGFTVFALVYKDPNGETLLQKGEKMLQKGQAEVKQKTVGDFQDITNKREKQIEEVTGEAY